MRSIMRKFETPAYATSLRLCLLLKREVDSNHRPQGYEPCELPAALPRCNGEHLAPPINVYRLDRLSGCHPSGVLYSFLVEVIAFCLRGIFRNSHP